MIAETKTSRVDIRQGAAHLVLRAPLATMDNMAHVFEAQVYDGDAAADLSGATCEAYFIRADGVTVMLDGTVSGSTASVTLGANCYAVPGRFELAVKLTQGDVTHTILRAEGSVTTSRTDAMTGAGSGVHSFDQLEQQVAGLSSEVQDNAEAIADMNIAMQQRNRAWNLLDNSNFRDPVNQRDKSTYTGATYGIDRWRGNPESTVTVNGGSITVSGKSIFQHIPGLNADAVLTFAYGNDAETHIGPVGYSASTSSHYVDLPVGTWTWAALYEGEYTLETLPAYLPKGYGAELTQCRRYYQAVQVLAGSVVATPQRQLIPLQKLRKDPTVTTQLLGGSAFASCRVSTLNTLDVTGANGSYTHAWVYISADF